MEGDSNDPRGFRSETSRVHGAPRLPTSKSLAQRHLIAASLASGETRLEGLPDSDDVRAARGIVRDVFGRVTGEDGDCARISGTGPDERLRLAAPLALSESGTLARLVTAVCGLVAEPGVRIALVPSGTLARRSSPALFRALRDAGCTLDDGSGGDAASFAAWLTPGGAPDALRILEPSSSQEVSGLLLGLAASGRTSELAVRGAIPSRPYLDMTLACLRQYGVTVHEEPLDGGTRFRVTGPLRSPGSVAIEPDASAAAVALAAGALSGGEVRVPGLGSDARSLQGDVRIVEHLAAFGIDAVSEPGELRARGFPTRAAEVDLEREPDLAPVLAAVAAAAALRHGGESRLTGLGTLPGKESSRIAVLAAGLAELGLETEATSDSLRIARGTPHSAPRVLDPAGDHRMAFAFALCSLFLPGVLVAEPGCVAKSWPGFWRDLEAAGAVLESP